MLIPKTEPGWQDPVLLFKFMLLKEEKADIFLKTNTDMLLVVTTKTRPLWTLLLGGGWRANTLKTHRAGGFARQSGWAPMAPPCALGLQWWRPPVFAPAAGRDLLQGGSPHRTVSSTAGREGENVKMLTVGHGCKPVDFKLFPGHLALKK